MSREVLSSENRWNLGCFSPKTRLCFYTLVGENRFEKYKQLRFTEIARMGSGKIRHTFFRKGVWTLHLLDVHTRMWS